MTKRTKKIDTTTVSVDDTQILDLLHPLPDDDATQDAAPNDQSRKHAAELLAGVHFKTLLSVQQQVDAPRIYGSLGDKTCTETLDLVAATLGTKPASQQRALICFTSRTYQSEPGSLPEAPRTHWSLAQSESYAGSLAQRESTPLHAVHLLNVTEKHKFQPVLAAMLPTSWNMGTGVLRQQTSSGTQGLASLMSRAGLRQYGYGNDSALKLLVVAARARADADAEATEPEVMQVMQVDQDGGAGPSSSRNGEAGSSAAAATDDSPTPDSLSAFAKKVVTVLPMCKAAPFPGEAKSHAAREGFGKTVPIGSGVGLLLWTHKAKVVKANGKEKLEVTDASKRAAASLEQFAPKENVVRKEGFKVAKAIAPAEERDADATWTGSCGLVDIISPDELVMVLKFADHHTRAVWSELVCKSFRILRAEPALFSTIRLFDRSRGEYRSRGDKNDGGRTPRNSPWKSGAEHWANIVASKSNVITALDLSGNEKAPLTALKACLRAAPATLRSLDLDNIVSVNGGTLKEISRFTQLEELNLNCGSQKDGIVGDGSEQAIIQLVKQMPRLSLLRVQPCTLFGSFLGDWRFVADYRQYKPEYLRMMEEEGETPYPDTSGSGFESDDDYVNWRVRHGQQHLDELQQALPRGCRLTNSGWLATHCVNISAWGEKATDLPAWHVWKANIWSKMTEEGALRGTSYLQCGPRDGLEPRRYATHAEWLENNKPIEKLKPLGPVIHT